MPLISQAITEVQTHIYKPVIDQISHRVLRRLGYDKLIGDRIYINTDFTTHSHTSTLEGDAVIGPTAFRVDAQIRDNPSSQKWDFYTFHHTAAYGIGQRQLNNTFPTYLDKKNSIRIVEFRSPVTIEMNCELIVNNADDAYRVPQEIFNAYENGAIITYQDLIYDYPVPKLIVNELIALWKLDRFDGEASGRSFDDYIQMHTDETYAWNVHRTAKGDYELIVPCFNLKALMSLEYSDDRPQANKENRMSSSYTISFVVAIQFGMPTINTLQYPVVMTNRLVPNILLPRDTSCRHNAMPERHQGIADEFYDKLYHSTYHRPVVTPYYDEWRVPSTANVCKARKEPFAIMHLLVDEANPDLETTACIEDFKDPAFEIKPVIKEILYQQGEDSVRADAIYTVALFEDDNQMMPVQDYTFDESLTLHFKATDLNRHYRLVLLAPLRIASINPKWWDLLKKYYKYLNPMLQQIIRQELQKGGLFHDPSYPDRIYVDENGFIYDALTGKPIDKNLMNNDYPIRAGGYNGNYTEARVITNSIIARKAGQS